MLQQWMILVDLSNCVYEVTAYVIHINFICCLHAIFAMNVLCPAEVPPRDWLTVTCLGAAVCCKPVHLFHLIF